MASYTIATLRIDEDSLRAWYISETRRYRDVDWTDLNRIFEVALTQRDRFPGINLQGANNPQLYIEKWVKGYVDAISNPPSKRTAKAKSACTDPAIRIIVQATQGLSAEEATQGELNHNLFMSAENIQGNLLEEYIASRTRRYGFLWCDGNVLRAVDFCNTDGSLLLQVKNKSNTENSSSSNIREGTAIEKWYRLGTRTRGGINYPDYKWPKLNALINRYRTEGANLPPCNMTEEDYQAFLIQRATENPMLISNQ